jgi:hypothetical protein
MRVSEQGSVLPVAAINDFEKRHGIVLPSDYKAFLQFHNGGRPIPNCFHFTDGSSGSDVQEFFSLTGGRKTGRLDYILQIYAGRIPNGLLPVASDSFGNAICVGLVGSDFAGHVLFWDHELESDVGEPASTENLTPIARSFSEFIDGLFTYSD